MLSIKLSQGLTNSINKMYHLKLYVKKLDLSIKIELLKEFLLK